MEKPWGHAIMRNMKTKRQLDRYEGWTHHDADTTERNHSLALLCVVVAMAFIYFFL
jgi:hypothetical protein